MTIKKYTILFLILCTGLVYSKGYKGGELRTSAAYTYGRFEVSFIPAKVEGVVSSFFTYHEISSLADWNEIDFEFVGRYDNNIQVNAIAPGQINHASSIPLSFNPYAGFHTYAFEWTPDYIAWFVDGVEILRQEEDHIDGFNRSQKIMMNIWPPDYPGWVGDFDENNLPARAYYDWVSYASYTPGSGSTGTGNNFTPQWKDEFNSYNTQRWGKGTHTWNGNNSDFVTENVQFKDGLMILCLTKEGETGLVDNQKPVVLWAKEDSRNRIKIRFSERIDSASAVNTNNFQVQNAAVTGAVLSEDGTVVTLYTQDYESDNSPKVIIKNISDDEETPNTLSITSENIIKLPDFTFPLMINTGGDAGSGYLADKEYQPDSQYGYLDGSDAQYAGNLSISNTSEPFPFRSDRYGLKEYRIDVPRGYYNVKLQFAEKYFDQGGSRIFDIQIEDVKITDDFDPAAEAGKNSAVELEQQVFVDDDRIDIYFINEVDNAIVSGIVVEQITTEVETDNNIELNYNLNQNYPNPFNPETVISFDLAEKSDVKIVLYDNLGQLVEELTNTNFNKGHHNIVWNGSGLSSGIYFYKMTARSTNSGNVFRQTKKMIYLK